METLAPFATPLGVAALALYILIIQLRQRKNGNGNGKHVSKEVLDLQLAALNQSVVRVEAAVKEEAEESREFRHKMYDTMSSHDLRIDRLEQKVNWDGATERRARR